jgi:hypothetical protein
MKLHDPITKWSFTCPTDPGDTPPAGGIVLQQVTHEGHNFAKDIRVIGVRIATELVAPSGAVVPNSTAEKLYILDAATFSVSPINKLIPTRTYNPTNTKPFDDLKGSDQALEFARYFNDPKDAAGNYVGYGVSAKYDAPALLASLPNSEFSGLTIEQIFLFSRYAADPPHEPSGGLTAARCFPMIHYRFTKNASFDKTKPGTRVGRIRFDYRLHLFLDRHHDAQTNATLAQLGNQAGVFADSDTALGTAAAGFGSGFQNLFVWGAPTVPTAVSHGAFDAVEKPLLFEIVTLGLGQGFPKYRISTPGGTPRTVRCWDNVHWWGGRGPNAPLISAPGAFHCAHMHWRWGAAARPAVGGDPRFNPTTWPTGMVNPDVKGMWGPLLDPKIWIQSLRVAVVKNEPRLDPTRGAALSSLSTANWQALFDRGVRPPDPIAAGEDIVLWFSAEVHRSVEILVPGGTAPARTYLSEGAGTIFIHGLFFSHDAERTGLTIGSTARAYRPTGEAALRSSRQWSRSAN